MFSRFFLHSIPKSKLTLHSCHQIEKMEEVAQGKVWTGEAAASHGLVDAIGGLSRAIAIAKWKANIPQDRQVSIIISYVYAQLISLNFKFT